MVGTKTQEEIERDQLQALASQIIEVRQQLTSAEEEVEGLQNRLAASRKREVNARHELQGLIEDFRSKTEPNYMSPEQRFQES